MTVSFFHPSPVETPFAGVAESGEDFGAMLGPIMAGAWARGIADAFELVGAAAILLDRAGAVLHCGSRVEARLSPLVRIVGGQLLGTDPSVNEKLTAFLSRAVAEDPTDPSIDIMSTDRASGVRLKAVRPPKTEPSAPQLLNTILLVEPIAIAP